MALIDATISPDPDGCPSGLQPERVADTDPLGGEMDILPYVTEKDGLSHISLIVQGAHCGGCIAKIERGVGALEGVINVRMNLSAMRLNVTWNPGSSSPRKILRALTNLGYGAAPYEITAAQNQSINEQKALLRAMAVAGFATMNVMLLSIAVWSGGADMQVSTHTVFHWISAMIALPAVAYAGRPFFRSAWAALKNARTNMDVPISLAIILACSLSLYETIKGNPDTYFDAALMLLFLLLIGRYLDAKLRAKTGEAALKLAAMQSSSATRILEKGKLETIAARQVNPGDILLIPAGQRIPVDSEIIEGTSDIDVQIATGETRPVTSGPGQHIYSGTINLSAPLTVRAMAAETDSFLSEISKLVEIGEQGKSKYVKIADRAARLYVPIVHTLALATFIGWMLVGADLRPAAINAIAVLIITCPCALGLAVPAVQIVASGQLFKQGILLKSGDALERLAEVKWVVFDKTGTLTTGEFKLDNQDAILLSHLQMASALALHSKHPIAKALHNIETPYRAKDVIETAGHGLTGMVDGQNISFGTPASGGVSGNGLSESQLSVGDDIVQFLFRDTPRDEAKNIVAELKQMNLTSELLSGDNEDAAQMIARQTGIERARGGVSPQDKQSILYQRESEARYPLMVGDGINDAPALAAAHASVTLASGSDISRAAADVILQNNDLTGLTKVIRIARQAQKRVKENLSLAVIYNLMAVPLAVFGFVSPLIAALAMSGSSLLVTLNALRMRTI